MLSLERERGREEGEEERGEGEGEREMKRGRWGEGDGEGEMGRELKAPYTHDKVLLFWITFYFTSSVCLCVGYKMKTCTQISDSRFRGKINVVNPGDSAKRASPGRRAGFSHVNARLNPALLLGLALPRGLALLHINTPKEKIVLCNPFQRKRVAVIPKISHSNN